MNNYTDSLVVMLKDSTKFVLPKEYTVTLTDTAGRPIGDEITMSNNQEITLLYQANGTDIGLSLIPQGGFKANQGVLEDGKTPCIVIKSPGSFTEISGKVMAVFTFNTSTAPVTIIKTIYIKPED